MTQGMKGCIKCCSGSGPPSTHCRTMGWCTSSSRVVQSASNSRLSIFTRWDCCSHSLCQAPFGQTLRWILLKDFRMVTHRIILTVVDRLSKYAHFLALGHPYYATSIAKVFFKQVVRLHSVSASIISDRDPVFTSMMWRELFQLSDTQLRTSSAFHPQTGRQSEVTNCIIMVYLHCLAGHRPRS
jgi:hypothetical protein